jgi:hypothetical protein
MKKVLSVALMALALAVTVAQIGPAWTQDTQTSSVAMTPGKKPGVVTVQTVSEKATVESVDGAARMVTLKFPDGKMQAYKVGPAVKNLDQVKAGDEINATYAQSVALYVRKAGDQPSAGEMQTVQVAPKGAKPGMMTTDTSEMTAKVEAIDYAKRTVTLKGPKGNVVTLAVDKRVKRFKAVKVGDDLVLRVTNAMLIDVQTPGK